MTSPLNLDDTYEQLLRSRFTSSFSPPSFPVGNSSFSGIPARFADLDAPAFDERDILDFAVVASMRAGRFSSLATVSPFEKPKAWPFLSIPTLYLFSDDEHRNFHVAGAGGAQDVLRFKADNEPDTALPVILVIEHNEELIRTADLVGDLVVKLNRGVFARGNPGNGGNYVDGRSFDLIKTPTTTFRFDGEPILETVVPGFYSERSLTFGVSPTNFR